MKQNVSMSDREQSRSEHRRYAFRKAIGAVKEDVSLEEEAARWTALRRTGERHVGRCPLPDHDDRTPSFCVYPGGRWHCFGCKRGGDVVDLRQHCGGVDEPWAAMLDLARDYGVALPGRPARWHEWQRQKYGAGGLRDQLDAVRMNVRRRRWFRVFIEPELVAIGDPEERRREAERAWADLQGVRV